MNIILFKSHLSVQILKHVWHQDRTIFILKINMFIGVVCCVKCGKVVKPTVLEKFKQFVSEYYTKLG